MFANHRRMVAYCIAGKMYDRVEECGRRLPTDVIDLLTTSISVNTSYTSCIVVSFAIE